MSKPLLSVVMITYGHEKFIKQAIESILEQKTDFQIEFIISNDASPDNTSVIITELIAKAPKNISVLYTEHADNLGMMQNFIWALEQSTGKYIALCEGDDFWTDPLKLQKQVDFLEANPDYNICFHNVEEVDLEGSTLEKRLVQSSEVEKTFTIEDLAKNNIIHTVTVVFRNNVNALPEFLRYSPMGDYPLHMINATFGKIKYFPEKMAAYRVGVGLWSSQSINNQIFNTIVGLKLMITYFSSNKEVVTNLENQIKILANSLVNKHTVADPEKTAYNLPFKKLIIIFLKKFRHLF